MKCQLECFIQFSYIEPLISLLSQKVFDDNNYSPQTLIGAVLINFTNKLVKLLNLKIGFLVSQTTSDPC